MPALPCHTGHNDEATREGRARRLLTMTTTTRTLVDRSPERTLWPARYLGGIGGPSDAIAAAGALCTTTLTTAKEGCALPLQAPGAFEGPTNRWRWRAACPRCGRAAAWVAGWAGLLRTPCRAAAVIARPRGSCGAGRGAFMLGERPDGGVKLRRAAFLGAALRAGPRVFFGARAVMALMRGGYDWPQGSAPALVREWALAGAADLPTAFSSKNIERQSVAGVSAIGIVVPPSQDAVCASFSTSDSELSLAQWPHKFSLLYQVALTADSLKMTLQVTNSDEKPWSFQAPCARLASEQHRGVGPAQAVVGVALVSSFRSSAARVGSMPFACVHVPPHARTPGPSTWCNWYCGGCPRTLPCSKCAPFSLRGRRRPDSM